jgi:hypothetical protein
LELPHRLRRRADKAFERLARLFDAAFSKRAHFIWDYELLKLVLGHRTLLEIRFPCRECGDWNQMGRTPPPFMTLITFMAAPLGN